MFGTLFTSPSIVKASVLILFVCSAVLGVALGGMLPGNSTSIALAQGLGETPGDFIAGMERNEEASPDWAAGAIAWLFSWVSDFVSAILSFAGQLFDWVIIVTVIQMGDRLTEGGSILPGILFSWSFLRDIANIIFIFAMVFIGIATILNLQQYGYKALLVRLIIVALLINFSLLFARVTIDVSNLAGTAAYNTIMASIAGDPDPDQPGISGVVMNQGNLSTLHDWRAVRDMATGLGTDEAMSVVAVLYALGIVLMTIITFVFLAGAFMLIARFAILTFLMIISPVAFAAMILPQTRGMANRWWETFLKQAFFAPAFLIALFVALGLTASVGEILNVENYSLASVVQAAELENPSIMEAIIMFGVSAIGFMVALIVASQMGAYGANAAMSMGQQWSRNTGQFARRMAGNATLGSSAYVGRRTVGAVGARIADNKSLKDKEAEGSWGAKSLRSLGIGASKTSFDVRQIGGVGNKLGIGEGAKGGIAKSRADRVKAEEERAKELEKESSTQHEKEKMAELNKQKSDAQSRLGWKMQEFTDAMNKYGEDHDITKSKRDAADAENEAIRKLNTTIKKISDAKEARGMARKRAYADTLEKKSQTFTRKWITGTAPALAEAADTVRKSKSDLAKFQESLKKATKEIADEEKAASGSSASGGTGSGTTGGTGSTTTP